MSYAIDGSSPTVLHHGANTTQRPSSNITTSNHLFFQSLDLPVTNAPHILTATIIESTNNQPFPVDFFTYTAGFKSFDQATRISAPERPPLSRKQLTGLSVGMALAILLFVGLLCCNRRLSLMKKRLFTRKKNQERMGRMFTNVDTETGRTYRHSWVLNED